MSSLPGTLTWTRELLAEHGLHPKKQFGQNFLVDRNILSRIVEAAGVVETDTVFEIGAGLGSLTVELAQKAGRVIAIELDHTLTPVHRKVFAPYPNITTIQGDILRIDLEQSLDEMGLAGCPYKVVANLPYYITSPIIFKLLEECPHLELAVLMMQKEVADRILAGPGSKEYGVLSIMAGYHAEWEPVIRVKASCFWPRPEVDSAVLKMRPRKPSEKIQVYDEDLFRRIVRSCFQKRRKMLINSLSDACGLGREETRSRLLAAGMDDKMRPEELSLHDFARLSEIMS